MRDEQRLIGMTHQRLGKALEKQNALEAAEREYREAIAIERDLNDAISASVCHTGLAELLLKLGRIEEAEKRRWKRLSMRKWVAMRRHRVRR